MLKCIDEQEFFHAQLSWALKKFYNLGASTTQYTVVG